jgi:hypothetical protein
LLLELVELVGEPSGGPLGFAFEVVDMVGSL